MGKLKIFICGPHNTGKTTLLNDVMKHLREVKVVNEVARGVIQNFGWSRDDFLPEKNPETFYQLNAEIIKEQIRQDIDNMDDETGFICDRALDPLVYVRFYLGEEYRKRMLDIDGIGEWLHRMRSSCVFLVSPHKECIKDDKVRLMSTIDELQRLNEAFVEELNCHGIPFHTIDCLDRQTRVALVLRVIHTTYGADQ